MKSGKASEASAARLVAAIGAAFADDVAEPDPALLAAMTNDPKDRHVLAAAVEAGAGVVVTEDPALRAGIVPGHEYALLPSGRSTAAAKLGLGRHGAVE